jgi:hypothetical protein
MPLITLFGHTVNLEPGDSWDLKDGGYIVWFDGDAAEAVRLLHSVRSTETQRVIRAVEERCKKERTE